MSTRQRRLAAVTVGIGCAAIAGGIAVTAQAMASDSGIGTGATVGVVSVAADGSDPFQCTFDDVDLAQLLPDGLPAPSGAGTLVTGGAEVIAATPEDGAMPPLVVTGQSATGELPPPPALADGSAPVVLGQSQIREGTEEECSAIREQGLPVGTSGAVAVTGQSQLDVTP